MYADYKLPFFSFSFILLIPLFLLYILNNTLSSSWMARWGHMALITMTTQSNHYIIEYIIALVFLSVDCICIHTALRFLSFLMSFIFQNLYICLKSHYKLRKYSVLYAKETENIYLIALQWNSTLALLATRPYTNDLMFQ